MMTKISSDMGRPMVAVAMSGGVDSSVSALLLSEQGYEVMGLTMRLWKEPADDCAEFAQACASTPIADAEAVCQMLGIPHYVVDLRDAFKRAVVDYFIGAYARAITPNPCITCNRLIKFGLLYAEAQRLGAQWLATGHYARIERGDGQHRLLKARDGRKDQSYVLYRLTQQDLAHVLFPLGQLSKEQVREIARKRRLPVATKAESQENCFITDQDYRRFLRRYAPHSLIPGPIVDRRGRILGEHQGLPLYTIGQRKGLRIAAPEPLYVLELDPAHNALIVGTAAELGRSELVVVDVNYIAGKPPERPLAVSTKIRYNASPAEAVLFAVGVNVARLKFASPLRDITPGQSAVFYVGEEVIGGGVIAAERDVSSG